MTANQKEMEYDVPHVYQKPPHKNESLWKMMTVLFGLFTIIAIVLAIYAMYEVQDLKNQIDRKGAPSPNVQAFISGQGSGNKVVNLRCPPGMPGAPGRQGATGVPGAPGGLGFTGFTGPTGATGQRGRMGRTGSTGMTGMAGPGQY